MLIAGLTGSIGMGKSTVATMFERAGLPVFSADQAVHELYQGKASQEIERLFPGTVSNNVVDRQKLSQALMQDRAKFRDLEALIHPLVREAEWNFLKQAKTAKEKVAIIEIPLLFETGSDQLMDAVIVVSADEATQKQRVLARENMSEEKFQAILAQQMPDEEKKRNADFILDTGCTLAETENAVSRLIERLFERASQAVAYGKWQQLYENIQ